MWRRPRKEVCDLYSIYRESLRPSYGRVAKTLLRLTRLVPHTACNPLSFVRRYHRFVARSTGHPFK